MDCPDCGTAVIVFSVPDDLAPSLPGNRAGAALCPHCLSLHPASDPPDERPTFVAVGDAFPDGDAAVPMALLLGLLPSLATYRQEIGELLTDVERAGTDPLLVLDRLADDPDIDATADLERRRRQLEQLI